MSKTKSYRLWRFSSGAVSTIGVLMAGDPALGKSFRCFTLEDEQRAIKVPEHTRIPAGNYEIKLRKAGMVYQEYKKKYSWHNKGMLHLQNVPNFEWIYIHSGNRHSHTAGCILVGDGLLSNRPNVGEGFVSYSVQAYQQIYEEMTAHIEAGAQVVNRGYRLRVGADHDSLQERL